MILDDVESSITYWTYYTADSFAQVGAANYITDATTKRMAVGDIVDVWSGTLTNFSASTGGQTLGGATFSPTVGITARFSSVPAWGRFMVTAVGAGTTTSAGAATLTQIELPSSALGTAPRNLIQAGDFTTNPWQAGTSFNGSSLTPAITADRWVANAATSTVWTAGRTANTTVPGFSTAYVWGRSAGDTHTTGLSFGQVIETANSVRVQGLPVALSFWAVANANFAAGANGGTLIASIVSGAGSVDDTSGKMFSSAWTGMTTVATQTITPTTTVQRFGPIGGVVPTGCTQLGVVFSYSATTAATSPGITAGANESVQFMGMQLEAGGMSPFEHLDMAQVVETATRYLQVWNEPTAGIAVGPAGFSAASIALVHVPIVTPLRKSPTVTFNTGGWAVTDQGQTTHRVSAGGLQGAVTSGAGASSMTLLVTCAGTFSAGNSASPLFLQGQSTGLGSIVANADY
jgi:hypothetical protein